MARKRPIELPPVAADPEVTAGALAKAVAEGDIVNFRMVFAPFSPARDYTSEDFAAAKYRHLLVDDEFRNTPEFAAALALIQDKATWDHIQGELNVSRPPCLPSGPLMSLADNALRQGKYTVAAQAYESLRIRERVQSEFVEAADRLLESGEVDRAVKGYVIASGLNYDYAGFPDPVPLASDYPTRSLMLHGEYPRHPEDCVAALPPVQFLGVAFEHLLNDRELAKRLIKHDLEKQLAFLDALIRWRDPAWDEFAERFREACTQLERFAGSVVSNPGEGRITLQDELDAEEAGDPWILPITLLGRELADREWWKYLKELATKHPAAPLFVARQLMGEVEVIVPRLRAESPVPAVLGLPSEASGVVTAAG